MSGTPDRDRWTALYRVYGCTSCPNIGFGKLNERSEESVCNSCGATVSDGPEHLYVGTLQGAGWAVQWTIFHRHENDAHWDGRGLRSALSVFRVIEDSWRASKGKPLSVESVMRDCVASGLDEKESRGSIGWLDVDARITIRSGRIVEVLDHEVHLPP